MTAVRMLVVRVPDWPVVAAGARLDEPAAAFHANRVVSASPAARAQGVALHQRRREAQGRCPELVVLAHDPARDARAFEPLVVALEALTPRVEVVEPGLVAFPTRGPSRFFGGDEALAARARGAVAEALAAQVPDGCPVPPVLVGVADAAFAARLAADAAARSGPGAAAHPAVAARGPIATIVHAAGADPADVAASPDGVLVVAPGTSAAFLAPHPVAALDRPGLVDVLQRLGLTTLGAFAALPLADVVGRFGAEGQEAWRVARGLDPRPPALADPPAELTVSVELDPPAETVAPAAFLARGLAEELHAGLWARGSACVRVVIGAETEHGEQLERVWRAEAALSAAAIAERLRWQLDGWLQGSARHRPTAGISRLWLTPEEVIPAGGRQLGFWGTDAATADRASRAVARVQGLLGTGSVTVPEWRGSRHPATQIALVGAEAVDLTVDRPEAGKARVTSPWPGRLPAPSPAWVHAEPVPAEVVDAEGTSVGVSGRGELSAPPARLSVAGGPWVEVVAWAGPWPIEERWWDPATARRLARLQLVPAEGPPRLVALEAGRWHVTASYD